MISHTRLESAPADVIITPRLGKLGMLEFHRASEAISEDVETTEKMLPQIKCQLKSQA